jgi:UDP-N-acetylmuramoyl-tripeptide--D-alanyl-D-alanine ligase
VIFSTAEVAAIVGGVASDSSVEIDGASIDSRSMTPGGLFVPIVADRDGHEFIEAALAAGAAAYLTSGPTPGGTSITVDDTAQALTALGVAARGRLSGPVVGITGSVGKTSVKDLLVAAAGSVRRAHANPASFNNELGLPLTLLNAPDATEIAVLEMGARGIGHIAELCRVGRPTIGVVTCVAGAHTELFGSLEGVALGKGELVESLPAGGTAILNAEDHRVMAMRTRTSADVLTFGEGGDVRVVDLQLDPEMHPSFTIESPWGSAPVVLQLAGAHMATNAAAAIAAGGAAGIDLSDLVRGLEGAVPSTWRMEVATAPSGATVINDAYNANPTSVRAALAALAATGRGKRTAVLGVMAELGDERESEHLAVAEEALAAGVRVIAVDAEDYGAQVEHVRSISEAADRLGVLDVDDAVLVKGSRVAGLERLAAILLDDPAAEVGPS